MFAAVSFHYTATKAKKLAPAPAPSSGQSPSRAAVFTARTLFQGRELLQNRIGTERSGPTLYVRRASAKLGGQGLSA